MHTRFHMKNGLDLTASASVGLATCPPENDAVHAIIGAADARMYAVKEQWPRQSSRRSEVMLHLRL